MEPTTYVRRAVFSVFRALAMLDAANARCFGGNVHRIGKWVEDVQGACPSRNCPTGAPITLTHTQQPVIASDVRVDQRRRAYDVLGHEARHRRHLIPLHHNRLWRMLMLTADAVKCNVSYTHHKLQI